MRSREDRELAEKATHDPEAFGALYDRYFWRIYRLVYLRVRQEALAQELTTQVFFKALELIKRRRHAGTRFASWLGTLALTTLDRKGYQCELDARDLRATTACSQLVARRHSVRGCLHSLRRLPPHCRQLTTDRASRTRSVDLANQAPSISRPSQRTARRSISSHGDDCASWRARKSREDRWTHLRFQRIDDAGTGRMYKIVDDASHFLTEWPCQRRNGPEPDQPSRNSGF